MRISKPACGLVVQVIEEVLERAYAKQFLTEYDVQSWIFMRLADRLQIDSQDCLLGLHCQTQFLKDEADFGFIPDLAVFNLDEYSVKPDGTLYGKKGCTIWGDSILVEIKLYRGHRPFRKRAALKDIQKLADVRHRHYLEGLYYPIFVLVCRRSVSPELIQEIQQFADSNEVLFVWGTIRSETN